MRCKLSTWRCQTKQAQMTMCEVPIQMKSISAIKKNPHYENDVRFDLERIIALDVYKCSHLKSFITQRLEIIATVFVV